VVLVGYYVEVGWLDVDDVVDVVFCEFGLFYVVL